MLQLGRCITSQQSAATVVYTGVQKLTAVLIKTAFKALKQRLFSYKPKHKHRREKEREKKIAAAAADGVSSSYRYWCVDVCACVGLS